MKQRKKALFTAKYRFKASKYTFGAFLEKILLTNSLLDVNIKNISCIS